MRICRLSSFRPMQLMSSLGDLSLQSSSMRSGLTRRNSTPLDMALSTTQPHLTPPTPRSHSGERVPGGNHFSKKKESPLVVTSRQCTRPLTFSEFATANIIEQTVTEEEGFYTARSISASEANTEPPRGYTADIVTDMSTDSPLPPPPARSGTYFCEVHQWFQVSFAP